MEKIGKLKITRETVKVLTDTELQSVRGGLGSAMCSNYCTGDSTSTCANTWTTSLQTCGCKAGDVETASTCPV